MVLTISHDFEVTEEIFSYKDDQMWKRKTANSNGYFILKNPATGKLLTAKFKDKFGPDRFTVEGTYSSIARL